MGKYYDRMYFLTDVWLLVLEMKNTDFKPVAIYL